MLLDKLVCYEYECEFTNRRRYIKEEILQSS